MAVLPLEGKGADHANLVLDGFNDFTGGVCGVCDPSLPSQYADCGGSVAGAGVTGVWGFVLDSGVCVFVSVDTCVAMVVTYASALPRLERPATRKA